MSDQREFYAGGFQQNPHHFVHYAAPYNNLHHFGQQHSNIPQFEEPSVPQFRPTTHSAPHLAPPSHRVAQFGPGVYNAPQFGPGVYNVPQFGPGVYNVPQFGLQAHNVAPFGLQTYNYNVHQFGLHAYAAPRFGVPIHNAAQFRPPHLSARRFTLESHSAHQFASESSQNAAQFPPTTNHYSQFVPPHPQNFNQFAPAPQFAQFARQYQNFYQYGPAPNNNPSLYGPTPSYNTQEPTQSHPQFAPPAQSIPFGDSVHQSQQFATPHPNNLTQLAAESILVANLIPGLVPQYDQATYLPREATSLDVPGIFIPLSDSAELNHEGITSPIGQNNWSGYEPIEHGFGNYYDSPATGGGDHHGVPYSPTTPTDQGPLMEYGFTCNESSNTPRTPLAAGFCGAIHTIPTTPDSHLPHGQAIDTDTDQPQRTSLHHENRPYYNSSDIPTGGGDYQISNDTMNANASMNDFCFSPRPSAAGYDETVEPIPSTPIQDAEQTPEISEGEGESELDDNDDSDSEDSTEGSDPDRIRIKRSTKQILLDHAKYCREYAALHAHKFPPTSSIEPPGVPEVDPDEPPYGRIQYIMDLEQMFTCLKYNITYVPDPRNPDPLVALLFK